MKGEIIPAGDTAPLTRALNLEDVGAFLRLYVADGDASPQTIRAYQSHISQFVQWARSAGMDPLDPSDRLILLYRRFLVESEYTRGTIGVKLSAVGALYNAMMHHGMVQVNPVEGIGPPRSHTDPKDRILQWMFSKADVRAILTAIPQTPGGTRDRAIVTLGFVHGLRVSEVVNLALSDYDPKSLRLFIRASKGKRDRIIILVKSTIERVDRWLTERRKIAPSDEPALFVSLSPNNEGGALTTAGVRYVFNLHTQTAGLRMVGRSFHGLRHGHATEAIRGGANPHTLAQEMGHASTQTTDKYVHVAASIDDNPADLLELDDPEDT